MIAKGITLIHGDQFSKKNQIINIELVAIYLCI